MPTDKISDSCIHRAVLTGIRRAGGPIYSLGRIFPADTLKREEIAAVAGCSKKAVETRLYRARAILREKLQRWLAAT